MPGFSRRWLVVPLLASALGCTFDEVDLAGRDCPCGTGWVCVEEINECRKTRDLDSSQPDAGLDTVPTDSAMDVGDAAFDASQDPSRPDTISDSGLDAADALPDVPVVDADAGAPCTALICEDFEDPELPNWGLGPAISGSTEVSRLRSHSGTSALRTRIMANDLYFRHQSFDTPLTTGTVYLRVWVFLESGEYDNLTMFSLGEDSAPFNGLGGKVTNEDSGVFADYITGLIRGRSVTKDVWQCWSLEVGLDEIDGYVNLTIDGMAHGTLTGVDTVPRNGLGRVSVGVIFSGPSQTRVTYWLDDLAAGTSPLSCD